MFYATGLILYVLCYVVIQVVFLFCCCHVSQHRLRCSSFYRMLQIILKQHNGSVTWKKGDHSCILQLHF